MGSQLAVPAVPHFAAVPHFLAVLLFLGVPHFLKGLVCKSAQKMLVAEAQARPCVELYRVRHTVLLAVALYRIRQPVPAVSGCPWTIRVQAAKRRNNFLMRMRGRMHTHGTAGRQ